jgi:hypothetical protein
LALDGNTTAVIEEKEVLWRVNFEEFTRRLRHKVTLQQKVSDSIASNAYFMQENMATLQLLIYVDTSLKFHYLLNQKDA